MVGPTDRPSAGDGETVSHYGGQVKVEKTGTTERRTFTITGGMCPRCEGMGSVTDIDLRQLYDESKTLGEGAITVPGYTADGWMVKSFSESGFLDPAKPIRDYSHRELQDFLYKEPTKVKVAGINITYEGLVPQGPEVVPVQGRRRDAAAHPGVRGAGGDLQRLPRLRWHPPQRGRAVVEDPGHQHRRRLRDADQRPRAVDPRPR